MDKRTGCNVSMFTISLSTPVIINFIMFTLAYMIHSKNNIFTIISIQLQPTFELNPLNGYCNGTYITTKVVNHYCSFDSIYMASIRVYPNHKSKPCRNGRRCRHELMRGFVCTPVWTIFHYSGVYTWNTLFEETKLIWFKKIYL